MSTTQGSVYRLVEFPSQGATLRGRLYEHATTGPGPTVVMTHGFSATITGMVADRYAEVLHAAGLNILLFDHRGFGLSGGMPRQILNDWVQARGYRDALDFVISLPTVDPTRVAIWGDSMSGAVAIGVAARIDAIDGILQELDLGRERRGLAKVDIARKLNLQPAAIRRLLTGPKQNPKIGRLIDLAHALDLEVVLRPKLALKNGMEAGRSGSAAADLSRMQKRR